MDLIKYEEKAIINAESYFKIKQIYLDFWKDVNKRIKEFKGELIPEAEWRLIKRVNNNIMKLMKKYGPEKVLKNYSKHVSDN